MAALPKEIDAYLKPFVRDAVGEPRLAAELVKAPALDGGQGGENKILGKVNERPFNKPIGSTNSRGADRLTAPEIPNAAAGKTWDSDLQGRLAVEKPPDAAILWDEMASAPRLQPN